MSGRSRMEAPACVEGDDAERSRLDASSRRRRAPARGVRRGEYRDGEERAARARRRRSRASGQSVARAGAA